MYLKRSICNWVFLCFIFTNAYGIKLLHVSLHKGCTQDIQEVARELGIDVTSWYILESAACRIHFDGIDAGNDVYNITHERAQRIWQLHKDYFEQFDGVITSDTAPLSRIFLQNNWSKPLIIWICNRFDYAHHPQLGMLFPDAEYYALFAKATRQKNVRIIGYTPYECYYVRNKGIELENQVIKPIGILPDKTREIVSKIPEHIIKKDTLFIFPRLDSSQQSYILQACQSHAIPVYTGPYDGPDDLGDFKGVLFFPYAWSNLALFENLQRGIVHFVPSENFVLSLIRNGNPVPHVTLDPPMMKLIEWYLPEHAHLFVYFDSWTDLKNKIEQLDYRKMKETIIEFARSHRRNTLGQWQDIFKDLHLLPNQ